MKINQLTNKKSTSTKKSKNYKQISNLYPLDKDCRSLEKKTNCLLQAWQNKRIPNTLELYTKFIDLLSSSGVSNPFAVAGHFIS